MTKEYGTPGPRAIHPEVAHSRSLRATRSLLAMLLFDRLIACADDQGRLAGDANDVRIACLANALDLTTDAKVQQALEALAKVGMLTLYTVDDEPYIQLVHWWQWQGGQRRAYPSRHPAPPDWEDRVFGIGATGHGRDPLAVDGNTQPNAAQGGSGPPNGATGGLARGSARGSAHGSARTGLRAPGALTVPDTVPPARTRDASSPGGLAPLRDVLPPPPGYVPPKTRGDA